METSRLGDMPKEDIYGPLNGAVNQTAVKLHGAVDKAADSADALAQAVSPAISSAQDAAHATVDSAAEAASSTAAWLDQQTAKLQSASQACVADTRTFVSAHPLRSVVGALAAGYLIGRLAR